MKYVIFFQFFLAADKAYVLYPSKAFLFLTIPAAVIGFCGLIVVLLKFTKMSYSAEVCRVSLTAESEAEINQTGELDMCLEVPMLTMMAGSGLDYELFNKRDGRKIDLHRTAAGFMSRNNGVRTTFIVRKFEITETGTHLLKVSGIDPQTDYSKYALTISRPVALNSLLYVLGMICALALLIGGIIFSLIITNAHK